MDNNENNKEPAVINKVVTLVSGGVDSTLMSILAKEQGLQLFPLFVDYGHLAAKREWEACIYNHTKHDLPNPKRMLLRGFGNLIHSGLTDRKKRVKEDAFLPGRNTLFLIAASSYAYQVRSKNVAIGLLNDKYALFPDQTAKFVSAAERFLSRELEFDVKVLSPLMEFSKADVLRLAKIKRIHRTYSCHSGTEKPCGRCISCLEKKNALVALGGK